MFPAIQSSKLIVVTALLVTIICIVLMFKGRPAVSFDSGTPLSSNGHLGILTGTTEEKKLKGMHCEKNQRISPTVSKNIKVFLFFVGYPRSGHSIVGSVLDAHPHIVVSHELFFMNKWDSSLFNKENADSSPTKLYSKIYQKSMKNAMPGNRLMKNNKGYTLAIEQSCQGSFDNFIDVIGDKSGGGVVNAYLKNRTEVLAHYKTLKEGIGIPIKVVHVIRNPYDNIATMYLYSTIRPGNKAGAFLRQVKENKTTIKPRVSTLKNRILGFFDMTQAVTEIITLVGRSNVLDVHHSDFVHYSRETIVSLMEFLGVKAKEDYLEICVDKIFKEINRSRDLLKWPSELREIVEQRIKEFPFLQQYNFNSD